MITPLDIRKVSSYRSRFYLNTGVIRQAGSLFIKRLPSSIEMGQERFLSGSSWRWWLRNPVWRTLWMILRGYCRLYAGVQPDRRRPEGVHFGVRSKVAGWGAARVNNRGRDPRADKEVRPQRQRSDNQGGLHRLQQNDSQEDILMPIIRFNTDWCCYS